MKRKPNTNCFICEKPIYRRPCNLKKFKNVYCSRDCLTKGQRTHAEVTCQYCGIKFFPKHSGKKAKTCSRVCSNKSRAGQSYAKTANVNSSKRRLDILKSKFSFEKCMIEGCDYNKTYDIHRLIKGKDGGKYEIGNMYAICPNHHAEIHRGLIEVEKIDNKTLRIIFFRPWV